MENESRKNTLVSARGINESIILTQKYYHNVLG